MAVNKEGNWISNANQTNVNAVTWGVFPGKEIVQPTVVDPASFMVWKDEAFEIWSRGWAQLFQESDPSRKLLEQVRSHTSSFLIKECPFSVRPYLRWRNFTDAHPIISLLHQNHKTNNGLNYAYILQKINNC